MPYHIILADDHKIIHEGINLLLNNKMPEAQLVCVSDLINLTKKIQEEQYHLIILDIDLPGGSALEFVKKNAREKHPIPILILSGYEEKNFAATFLKAGAMGYMDKKHDSSVLFEAIGLLLSGKRYLSPFMKDYILNVSIHHTGKDADTPLTLDVLSEKETEIARMLTLGLRTKEIAERMGISVSNMAVCKNRILSKLKIENTIQLAKLFNITGRV